MSLQHRNVSTIKSVKYLYKYVHKGSDRMSVKLSFDFAANVEDAQPAVPTRSFTDEVEDCLDCRQVSFLHHYFHH